MNKPTHPRIEPFNRQFTSNPKVKKRGIRFALLLCSLALTASNVRAGDTNSGTFVNPICEQADPWITQDQGRYLACFSEGNRAVSIQISDRLTSLGVKHVVWTAPETGPASREVWGAGTA